MNTVTGNFALSGSLDVPLAVFIIFSGLWANLMLQCGLGITGVSSSGDRNIRTCAAKLCIIFAAVLLLWIIFEKLVFSVSADLFVYILVFPAGSIVYDGLEYLYFRFILKKKAEKDSHISFCNGITAAALFICLNIAGNFIEAAFLSFGFVFGIFLSVMILREIRRRAALEAVPRFLRGNPLFLISMGLLSLIFYASSLMFFGMFGG